MSFSPKTQAFLALMLVFLTGAALGFALGHRAGAEHVRGSVPVAPAHFDLSSFEDRLALTATQQQELRGILEGGRERAESLLNPLRPKMEAYREEMIQAFRRVLDERQRQTYDAMLSEMQDLSVHEAVPRRRENR